jgi:hypothetical protein
MEVTKWLKPRCSRSHIGDRASVRAATRVNAEQASKRTMRRPTRQRYRGRLIRLGETSEDDAQPLHWCGADFWIIPVTKRACPAIAIKGTYGNREEQKLLMRFISMLSWVEDTGYALEGGGLSGGNLPRPMGRQEGGMILTWGARSIFPISQKFRTKERCGLWV